MGCAAPFLYIFSATNLLDSFVCLCQSPVHSDVVFRCFSWYLVSIQWELLAPWYHAFPMFSSVGPSPPANPIQGADCYVISTLAEDWHRCLPAVLSRSSKGFIPRSSWWWQCNIDRALVLWHWLVVFESSKWTSGYSIWAMQYFVVIPLPLQDAASLVLQNEVPALSIARGNRSCRPQQVRLWFTKSKYQSRSLLSIIPVVRPPVVSKCIIYVLNQVWPNKTKYYFKLKCWITTYLHCTHRSFGFLEEYNYNVVILVRTLKAL